MDLPEAVDCVTHELFVAKLLAYDISVDAIILLEKKRKRVENK